MRQALDTLIDDGRGVRLEASTHSRRPAACPINRYTCLNNFQACSILLRLISPQDQFSYLASLRLTL